MKRINYVGFAHRCGVDLFHVYIPFWHVLILGNCCLEGWCCFGVGVYALSCFSWLKRQLHGTTVKWVGYFCYLITQCLPC